MKILKLWRFVSQTHVAHGESWEREDSKNALTFEFGTSMNGHIAKNMKIKVSKGWKVKIVEIQKIKCMVSDLHYRQSWPPSIRFLPSKLAQLEPFENLAFWTPKIGQNRELALDGPWVGMGPKSICHVTYTMGRLPPMVLNRESVI